MDSESFGLWCNFQIWTVHKRKYGTRFAYFLSYPFHCLNCLTTLPSIYLSVYPSVHSPIVHFFQLSNNIFCPFIHSSPESLIHPTVMLIQSFIDKLVQPSIFLSIRWICVQYVCLPTICPLPNPMIIHLSIYAYQLLIHLHFFFSYWRFYYQ